MPHNHSLFSKIINRLINPIKEYKNNRKIKNISRKFVSNLKIGEKDTVILMEYMDKSVNQNEIADFLKKKYPNIKIYGLSHLVPKRIDQLFNKQDFNRWIRDIDYIITFGSSLTRYYIDRGVSESKVITTFHYVDRYYKNEKLTYQDFKILIQGNMMRNVNLIQEIVRQNPSVDFILCQGIKDLSTQFGDLDNVKLMPFLNEGDLRKLMEECPVSLNVMEDTIGSNVIVTSMAMGQAMICSDVGSIRDYCDDTNCIFCKNITDFNNAIRLLSNNFEILSEMRVSSIKRSENLTIDRFAKKLLSEINSRD